MEVPENSGGHPQSVGDGGHPEEKQMHIVSRSFDFQSFHSDRAFLLQHHSTLLHGKNSGR